MAKQSSSKSKSPKSSTKSQGPKKQTKKEKREEAKDEFKKSFDKHLPSGRQGIEMATFAGLTTMYYYGAEPFYEKAINLGQDVEIPQDFFAEVAGALAEFNITIHTELLKGLFPGGLVPGVTWDDMKRMILGAVIDESPPGGMSLDVTL